MACAIKEGQVSNVNEGESSFRRFSIRARKKNEIRKEACGESESGERKLKRGAEKNKKESVLWVLLRRKKKRREVAQKVETLHHTALS